MGAKDEGPIRAGEPFEIVTLDPRDYITGGADMTIKQPPLSQNISVTCGDGRVLIDMKTGAVSLENCTLEEGAKAFWDAVSRYAGGRP